MRSLISTLAFPSLGQSGSETYLKAVHRAGGFDLRPLHGIRIRRGEDRLTIELPADSLFPAGSAALTERARRVIFSLAGILRNVGNRIDIHGHTDPSPVHGDAHGSNWELSIARASSVAEELRRSGYRHSIAALGYADTRFGDVSTSAALSRAYSAARRVDVIVRPIRPVAR